MKHFKQFRTRTVLDDVCEIHGCHLWSVKIPVKGKVEEISQCPECEKENIRLFEKQLNMNPRSRVSFRTLMRSLLAIVSFQLSWPASHYMTMRFRLILMKRL